jgi:predicted ester cyclase
MSGRFIASIQSAVDKFNAGDVDGYLSAFAPDCPHWIGGGGEPMQMSDFADSMRTMRRGLPDLRLEAVSLFGVGNYVCAQWRTQGTHTGALFGMAATGRRICFDTAEAYELDDIGRVTASWTFGDTGVLFRQLEGSEEVTS